MAQKRKRKARTRRKRGNADLGRFARLESQPGEDLFLPSLARNRLEGHAYRFTIVLPLLMGSGEEVFSQRQVLRLTRLLDLRFRGSTQTTAIPHPPLIGSWLPDDASEQGIDRNMTLMVYSRITDAADQFFAKLKSILMILGDQEEILVERLDAWLLPGEDNRTAR